MKFELGREAIDSCVIGATILLVVVIVSTAIFGTVSYHKYENSKIAAQAIEDGYVQTKVGNSTIWVKDGK